MPKVGVRIMQCNSILSELGKVRVLIRHGGVLYMETYSNKEQCKFSLDIKKNKVNFHLM